VQRPIIDEGGGRRLSVQDVAMVSLDVELAVPWRSMCKRSKFSASLKKASFCR
jgi:hypothetical protein